jgi:hypothetical protein
MRRRRMFEMKKKVNNIWINKSLWRRIFKNLDVDNRTKVNGY